VALDQTTQTQTTLQRYIQINNISRLFLAPTLLGDSQRPTDTLVTTRCTSKTMYGIYVSVNPKTLRLKFDFHPRTAGDACKLKATRLEYRKRSTNKRRAQTRARLAEDSLLNVLYNSRQAPVSMAQWAKRLG